MTMVVTILIGVGIVLITSSIDCTPILMTLQKIASNQAIDWTGQSCQPLGSSNTPTATAPATIGSGPTLIDTLSNGRCPPGYVPVYVSGGKRRCQPQ